jgi:tetratricopeptide (TPR) repeat protein
MDDLETASGSRQGQYRLAVWTCSFGKVGDGLKAQGKIPEALGNYQAEWTILKQLADQDKANTDWQCGLAGSFGKVGDELKAKGQIPQALQNYEAGLVLWKQLVNQDSGITDWQRGLADSFEKVGDVLTEEGKLSEGLQNYQQELKIAEKLAAEDKTNADVQRELIVATWKVGTTLQHGGDRKSQEKGQMILQQALDLLKAYFGTDKSNLVILVTEAMQIEGQ